MRVFPNMTSYSPHIRATAYGQMNRGLLQSCQSYQSWIASTESCLLFLSGGTALEGRRLNLTHSWLSPAATYIAEDLGREKRSFVFFSCHPELDSKLVPTKQVISSIILQILKWRPRILREKAVQYQHAVLSEAWRDASNEKIMVSSMIELLNDLLAAVKELGTTFIVIDRLDQCESELRVVMDELVRLVGDAACNVKLAVIAETSYGRGYWHPEYLREDEYALKRVFCHKDWNQGRMTHQEMNRRDWPLTWSSDRVV
jgi:hypothetical protein